jgi:hypothetical protein
MIKDGNRSEAAAMHVQLLADTLIFLPLQPTRRQRKKKKFDDLQVAVEELSNRMAIITRLEGEASELRRREALATAVAATKELALQHAQAQLAQQQRKIVQQEQQLLALAQPSAASPPSQQEQLTDSQQQQLCSKLLAALKDALNEVCSQHGLQASTAAQDQVLLRFQRSLSSCCREVLIPLPASAAAAMQAAAPAGPRVGTSAPWRAQCRLLSRRRLPQSRVRCPRLLPDPAASPSLATERLLPWVPQAAASQGQPHLLRRQRCSPCHSGLAGYLSSSSRATPVWGCSSSVPLPSTMLEVSAPSSMMMNRSPMICPLRLLCRRCFYAAKQRSKAASRGLTLTPTLTTPFTLA